MKTFLALLVSILVAFAGVHAQEVISNRVFSFSVPPGTSKISEQAFIDFSNKNFQYAEVLGSSDNLFKNNNCLLSFRINRELRANDKMLEGEERQWKSILPKAKNTIITESFIKSYPNCRFLVIKYRHGSDYLMKFIAHPNSSIEYMYGNIKYQAKDSIAAVKFLEGILNSFKYK